MQNLFPTAVGENTNALPYTKTIDLRLDEPRSRHAITTN